MSDSSKRTEDIAAKPSTRQFRLRTLILIMTAACLLLALARLLVGRLHPDQYSDYQVAITFFAMAVPIAVAARMLHQSIHNPWKPSENSVTVKVDAKWLRRIKSPLIMMPIASLTGVSVSFAPAYLFWCGPMDELATLEWAGVIASFLMIYCVPGFYMSLASEVMAQLAKLEDTAGGSVQD